MTQINDRINWIENLQHPAGYNKNDDNELRELYAERDREIEKQKTRTHMETPDDKIKDYFVDMGDEITDTYATGEIVDSWNEMTKYGFTMPGLYKFLLKIRWALLIVFIGIPWIAISLFCWVFNVVFNSWLNKGWAEGNVYLLFNTYFVFFQMLLSWPLFVEFPIYMRHFGMLRYISLGAAVIYNTIYFGLLAAWLYETYGETEI